MEWFNLYGADNQPTAQETSTFISSPLWGELNAFLHDNYDVEPSYSYSNCSAQPGWNVKYQKAGRSLCTLYPMDGFFIALVVIGAKEEIEAELLSPGLTPHVQELLNTASGIMGGRWLMIHVTDAQVLDDVKRLIQLRRKTSTKTKPTKQRMKNREHHLQQPL
ncbi:DUF3788 domain-containing protein [Christensenellaceae bacterium OttesenSCG-928-L17]|nr:DUF3788 domain-containing protein [Christensenellaceae bacterium OttesenSCG-928-L17]